MYVTQVTLMTLKNILFVSIWCLYSRNQKNQKKYFEDLLMYVIQVPLMTKKYFICIYLMFVLSKIKKKKKKYFEDLLMYVSPLSTMVPISHMNNFFSLITSKLTFCLPAKKFDTFCKLNYNNNESKSKIKKKNFRGLVDVCDPGTPDDSKKYFLNYYLMFIK